MRQIHAVALAAAVTVALWAPSRAQQADPAASDRLRIDVSQLGPQVGEQVPDFELPDQNGRVWTRESIMGSNGAMLVFVRSADW
jgi:hypothetical protein